MCRSIKTLRPPFTEEVGSADVRAAALQYVRKVSGTRAPTGKNLAAFELAVEQISRATEELVASLETRAPPKNREEEANKARSRNAARFG